jgi:signal transduction histidine kinase
LKSLYLRIWLTVVVVLAAFALVSGWVWQHQLQQERDRFESSAGERMAAWAELLQRSLPGADAPDEVQAGALRDWSARLRLALAMDDVDGRRIAASDLYLRREAEGGRVALPIKLEDGRTLWILRGLPRRPPGAGGPGPEPPRRVRGPDGPFGAGGPPPGEPPLALWGGGLPRGLGFVSLLAVLFVAIALGAYPVVRRLTRRLEALKQGVETFGAGALGHRVAVEGRDEVAAVAASFNHAAQRVESLVRSNQSLLANASHELRSPLARLKMAVAMMDGADAPRRADLKREIDADIAELDTLVEEVLLASRLDASSQSIARDPVDLLGLAAEEASRVGAEVGGSTATVRGDERLLRRALRNLLENASRYGGGEVRVELVPDSAGGAQLRVCDRGPGVPETYRERIFEPFFRLPGHAEKEGGVGLGLSLVRQIAQGHGGQVRCQPREGGGSCFVLSLPA